MTEQQQHLLQLLQQKNELETAFSQNRELFWKTQGAIEYLTQIGVTLPEPEIAEEGSAVQEETVEE